MTDEEKKAYDNLIMLRYFTMEKEDKESIGIILNLIEKQQKEIEELKAINQMQKYRIEVIDQRELISKDKIKAKVIEIKNRPVKDEFITATQGKLNTIIDIESLLDEEE